ncbi:uncharacterized protein LOC131932757 [Physella acuta]|uniref:uncharacterized protein LOC131932757 n=1 Tax=Physella acuta TaxID=109671 RepID=UPI0027DDF426|nr:uncharacterized protein LOC131932757 [Physella acuta]
MGNICDCLNEKKYSDNPSPRTPLLAGSSHAPTLTRQPSPIGQSARLNKVEKQDFESSLDAIHQIKLSKVSTVSSLDKTFQDHGKLYNDLYTNFIELRKSLNTFKSFFEAETSGIPIISDCLTLLAKRCGQAKLSGNRTKNCVLISYDRREVSQQCQGPPEDVIEIIELYNKINKLIKNILEKSPQVRSSITLVLEEEQKLKREVTKADPDGKLGPEPLKLTSENFQKLHKLPEYINTIEKYTSKTCKEILNGSKPLFEDV